MYNSIVGTIYLNFCLFCNKKLEEDQLVIKYKNHTICADCCRELTRLFWLKETEDMLRKIENIGKKTAEISMNFQKQLPRHNSI